jgi:hypothetical protein
MIGAIARQGAHHSAQKSMTGLVGVQDLRLEVLVRDFRDFRHEISPLGLGPASCVA